MPRYLYEVQGLRTVAALLVAVGHIWTGRISGGVDVFFVVFAYFMTIGLLRIDDTGRPREAFGRSADFLLRTARRLVPAMAIVVTATVIVFIAIGPRDQWSTGWQQALASLGFFENQYLIGQSDDYLINGTFVTPFQQFWALSLQGQFALLWALLIPACWLVARYVLRSRWSTRRIFTVLLVAITVGSLVLAFVDWRSSDGASYFAFAARAWEFTAGGLLAVAATRPRALAADPALHRGRTAGILLSVTG